MLAMRTLKKVDIVWADISDTQTEQVDLFNYEQSNVLLDFQVNRTMGGIH